MAISPALLRSQQRVLLHDVDGNPITSENPLSVSASVSVDTTGIATSAKQDVSNAALGAPADAIASDDVSAWSMTSLLKALRQKLFGTVAVSAASLPLPTGAATAVKQPALGTAGSASADVLSVQGIASMTALKVDGSAVTQPISAASLPLPAGAATAALQTTAAAQESTTSGQTGPLVQAAVVSGDQSYTAGKTDPLTLTPTGRLRVGLSSAGSVAPGTAGTNSDLVAGVYTASPGNAADGQQRALQQNITGALKVDGSAVTQPVDGCTASGSAVANAPVTVGGRAATANPTAVADGQVVNTMHTKHGKLVVIDGSIRELRGSQKTTISNSTAEVTIVTAGASGVFNDLYMLHLANTGATTTKVDIRDASSGSIIDTIEVPFGETRGWAVSAGSAVPQTTAANNWTAQCANATTAMEVTAFFTKNT